MIEKIEFCGKDVASYLNIEYVPDNANTYVFAHAGYNIEEQKFEGHDGGYYYGMTTEPKVFTLRFIYEETDIRKGLMSKIESFFAVGKSGKLRFGNRSWCWYDATVVDLNISQITNYLNGFIVVTMKAYYPFARCDSLSITAAMSQNELLLEDVCNNSALIPTVDMPATEFIGENISSQKSILLYNGGTQRAHVAIDIAGNVGTGVSIANSTTGQLCKFVGFNEGDYSHYLESDGLSGKTYWVGGTKDKQLAFYCHDNGFIDLEPAYPIERDVQIQLTAGSTTVTSTQAFDESMQGKYLVGNGITLKIVKVEDDSTVIVSARASVSGTKTVSIVTMNEITITPDSSMNLTYLGFKYKPTFA